MLQVGKHEFARKCCVKNRVRVNDFLNAGVYYHHLLAFLIYFSHTNQPIGEKTFHHHLKTQSDDVDGCCLDSFHFSHHIVTLLFIW